jgi:hypothetical protein
VTGRAIATELHIVKTVSKSIKNTEQTGCGNSETAPASAKATSDRPRISGTWPKCYLKNDKNWKRKIDENTNDEFRAFHSSLLFGVGTNSIHFKNKLLYRVHRTFLHYDLFAYSAEFISYGKSSQSSPG